MKPMNEAVMAASACALVLAGCVTATSTTTHPLTVDLMDDGFVQEVNVGAAPEANITARFAESMEEKLQSELADCADGAHPLRVDVALERAKAANPLKSMLFTDTNKIVGHVTIYSLETGAIEGQYDVDWKNRGGLGLTGAFIQSAMGQEQVTDGFADEICRRAFEGGEDRYETVEVLPF